MMFAHPSCAGLAALPTEAQSLTAEVVLHEQFPVVPCAKVSH